MKFNIIYADPPWRYKTYSNKGKGRSAENHYKTLDIEDIKILIYRVLQMIIVFYSYGLHFLV